MGSSLFKDFDEQFGSVIGDHVGLRKMRPIVEEDQKFHNPSNVIQIADVFSLIFSFISKPVCLAIPQGNNWIHHRRAACWEIASQRGHCK